MSPEEQDTGHCTHNTPMAGQSTTTHRHRAFQHCPAEIIPSLLLRTTSPGPQLSSAQINTPETRPGAGAVLQEEQDMAANEQDRQAALR